MPPRISDDTRAALLATAWDLMAEPGRLNVGMAEIAAVAGVSRQTLFYAFGNRAGLLVAMVRHRDTLSEHVPRMSELARGSGADLETLLAYVDAWLAHLRDVYPVAIQLEVASLSDPDAAAAWHDRIFGHGVRLGLDLILTRMTQAGAAPADTSPARLADQCLALLVPSAWRYLVVERGWTAEAFAVSRHTLIRSLLAPPARLPTQAGRRRTAARRA